MKLYGIILFSVLLTGSLTAMKPFTPSKDYLSTTTAISAAGFVSLENALKDVLGKELGSDLKRTGLTAQPLDLRYYMTLTGFNISLIPHLKPEQKDQMKAAVKQALEKATVDAMQKTLRYIHKTKGLSEPITLKFSYIGVFAKKVVGIFELSGIVETFMNKIESYFKNNINALPISKLITHIDQHQTIKQPHVALALIAGLKDKNPLFGHDYTPSTTVAEFHINKPEAIVSVQWRKAKGI